MSNAALRTTGYSAQSSLAARGYHVIYREHETNHCPGCGRSHWIIGRMSAECGFCGTALPFAAPRFAVALVPSAL